MSDSRVEKLAGPNATPDSLNAYDYDIKTMERAGLIVADPTDPAVIDRVAEVHRVHANLRGGRVMHCRCGEASPDQYGAIRWHSGHVARAVLAALGADQPEPPVSLSVQRRLDVMRGDRDE